MKIGFSQSNNWGSKLVRWFTNSQWSHCFIILDDDLEGDALVFESSPSGGVKLNLWSKYKDQICEVYNINVNCSIKPLYNYLGDNYGYLQITGFIIAKIFSLKHNPIKKDYVCSELALRFLIENNIEGFESLDPNSTSPEDLYESIKQHVSFIKI